MMELYYVHHNSNAWFVKSASFFEQQGGKEEEWGKYWKPIYADSIEHARTKAQLEFMLKHDLVNKVRYSELMMEEYAGIVRNK